mmetsp:Transcript_3495/g.4119  ORF Transcript_3495/g.4119 Transcript_3495/m.4119 type:complete len:279 (+) Transcript_3495:289-1125(+)
MERNCVHIIWPLSEQTRKFPPKLACLCSPSDAASGMRISMKRPPGACRRRGPSPSVNSSTIVPNGSSRWARLQTPANCWANCESLGFSRISSQGLGLHTRVDGHTACPPLTSMAAACGRAFSDTSSTSTSKAVSSRTFTEASAINAHIFAAAPGSAGTLRPPFPELDRPMSMAHQPKPLSTSSAPSLSESSGCFGSKARGTQAVAAPGSCTTAQNCPFLAAFLIHSGTPRRRRRNAMDSFDASKHSAPSCRCGSGTGSNARSTCMCQADAVGAMIANR